MSLLWQKVNPIDWRVPASLLSWVLPLNCVCVCVWTGLQQTHATLWAMRVYSFHAFNREQKEHKNSKSKIKPNEARTVCVCVCVKMLGVSEPINIQQLCLCLWHFNWSFKIIVNKFVHKLWGKKMRLNSVRAFNHLIIWCLFINALFISFTAREFPHNKFQLNSQTYQMREIEREREKEQKMQ